MVFPSAALLTVPLTVAVHWLKKPFIHAGFDNLNTDGHGCTQIFTRNQAYAKGAKDAKRKILCELGGLGVRPLFELPGSGLLVQPDSWASFRT